MGTIVAIGGGELRELETLSIDKHIVEATGKDKPRALFIPTASGEPQGYIDTFNKVYGEILGCETEALLLITGELSEEYIKNKILSSDLVYVGGGDTIKMLDIWKENSVDKYLKEAYEKGIILSGLSAGSICWFKYGHSDSNSFRNKEEWWDYTRAEGLGLINAIHCPHYNEEGREGFDEMMKSQQLVGIALENNCALVFQDGHCRIVKSDEKAKGYMLVNAEGTVNKNILNNESFKLEERR
jgi:dipeptidase E